MAAARSGARRRLVRLASVVVCALSTIGSGAAEAQVGLTANPGTVNFGSQGVGGDGVPSTESIEDFKTTVTITNSGSSPVTIGSITAEGGNPYAFSGLTGIEPGTYLSRPDLDCRKAPDGVTPRTIAPGGRCIMFVRADPTHLGTNQTTMTFRDTSGTALLGVALVVFGTEGYHVARAGGAVAGYGNAVHLGDVSGLPLGGALVGIEQAPSRKGYWLAASDGGVFSYGEGAGFYGSAAGQPLNAPVVGVATGQYGGAGSTNGYYLVARDGGVFNYGPNTHFRGSLAGRALNAPVVDIAGTHEGYWVAGADGGVFAFGQAGFQGSMVGQRLNAPIVAIVKEPHEVGYWLVGADGGVFAFGGAPFFGSLAGRPLHTPIVDMVQTPTGRGYWLLGQDGTVFAVGDAPALGNSPGSDAAVGMSTPGRVLAESFDGRPFL